VALALASAVVIAIGAIAVGIADSSWLLATFGGVVLWILIVLSVVGVAGVNESVREYERESVVDSVTALPNVERLVLDLEHAIGEPAGRHVLSMYLLHGIKTYTDAYGRACGDVLLSWLARKLEHAVGDRATVYRMRGSEFALLAAGDEHATAEVRELAIAALVEHGEGFVVYASVGEVGLSDPAPSVSEALKLADHRAHAHRRATELELGPEPPEDPSEATRSGSSRFDVAELATTVGRAMGVPANELDDVAVAAHLRDIGNMAVPNVILSHTGNLPPAEWRFIELHTLVGERLLGANFGMERVAALVRSSHERWDGSGYPNRLRGELIPLGSRIVFVCSAFEDMTSARAHRDALEVEDALAELERGAGTQFDPDVVRAFLEAYATSRGQDRGALASASHRRLRVLVADDDAATRFLLWRRVEAAGHECVTVDSGLRAWEMYRRERPDLVVLDSRLPELDGNELCRRIRRQPNAPFTYVLMVAALGDHGRIQAGLDAGADDFVTKPIVRQELDLSLVAAARAVALQTHPRRRAAQQGLRQTQ
jgi:response regulator RpfG family c-di-GMP phosphodiesterase/GGDEF domain-containing protein